MKIPGWGMFWHRTASHVFGLAALVLVLTSVSAAQGTGFLRADGQRIRDRNGTEFILKGMGLGGWLLPEGYMLNMSQFANANWEIMARVEDVAGPTAAAEFWRRYRANYVQKKDIDSLKAWGFNSVRLPMNYKLLTPLGQPYVYLEEGFAMIDSLLRWCEANQMYVILDLHSAPGGQSDEPISDYAGSPSLWESSEYRARTVDLWKTLATRYADEPWIGGYDLLNEPKWNLGAGNVPLRDLYIQITQAIRSVDTNHVIIVEGNWFATDMSGLTPPWDGNMVYSFHKYWNDTTPGTIGYLLNLRSSYNVPLWLGETGENSNEWFTRCVELMSDNAIGWAWWPHKKFNAISSPFSVPHTPAYENLLSYWRGQAARPTQQQAAAALLGMADRLDSDSCVVRRGVIDALFYHPFRMTRAAFAANALPGRIFASDYDNGRQGVAYNDADYQNTGSGGGNAGYQYRNDGVDLYACSDTTTNGFYVGRIASGEYLTYTVTVARTDTFTVALRYAANDPGGKVLFRWDGVDISPFLDLPVTGGWENWATMELGRSVFTEGTHELRMVFAFGGFNINYLEFRGTVADTGGGEDPVPGSYVIYQNYPNPFNPRTTVRYAVPERSRVTLEFLNMLGQQVDVLDEAEVDAGDHEVDWTPTVGSGVYICRLRAVSTMDGRTHTTARKMMILR